LLIDTQIPCRIANLGRFEAIGKVSRTVPGECGSDFRFNLLAGNGQVVATSESYKQKASVLNTIESIQKNVGGASVDDQTRA
jgi:uncharacterized protein YegP (UPF0339 family)